MEIKCVDNGRVIILSDAWRLGDPIPAYRFVWSAADRAVVARRRPQ